MTQGKSLDSSLCSHAGSCEQNLAEFDGAFCANLKSGKSLVEDMARAMSQSQSSVLLRGDDEQKRGAWREFARLGLSVLKDRLPADDRELVEQLTRRHVCRQGVNGPTTVHHLINPDGPRAADRIIALSASRDEVGAGARAGQTAELCRHGNDWNDNCEGCGRVWGSTFP